MLEVLGILVHIHQQIKVRTRAIRVANSSAEEHVSSQGRSSSRRCTGLWLVTPCCVVTCMLCCCSACCLCNDGTACCCRPTLSHQRHAMLLWSALRIGSVVHQTRQCGIPATAFTRYSPVQARSHGHFRLRPRCYLVCAMAKAAQGVVDTPMLDKHDFAHSWDLKALQIEARHCQSLMKKFAG